MNELFRKKIEPRCAYCKRGNPLDEDHVICPKHGVITLRASCGSFAYDPLKRVPAPPVRLKTGYSEEDMKID